MFSWNSLNIVHLKAFLFVEDIVYGNTYQRGFLTMTDYKAAFIVKRHRGQNNSYKESI